MMTDTEMLLTKAKEILAKVSYENYTFLVQEGHGGVYLKATYPDKCVVTGKQEIQHTRKWTLSPQMTTSEIVQTAFKCCLTSAEHRCREAFRYKETRVFGPHFDVEDLVQLCKSGKGGAGAREKISDQAARERLAWRLIRMLDADLKAGSEVVRLTLRNSPAVGVMLKGLEFWPDPNDPTCLHLVVDEAVAPYTLMQHILNSMSNGSTNLIRLQQYRAGAVAWIMWAKVISTEFLVRSADSSITNALVLEVRGCRQDTEDSPTPTTTTTQKE